MKLEVLLKDIEALASSAIAYRTQIRVLANKIHSIDAWDETEPTIQLLTDVKAFLVKFQSKSYIVGTWMNENYGKTLEEFRNTLDRIFPAQRWPDEFIDALCDEAEIHSVIRSSLKEYSALQLSESRIFNAEMMSNLNFLRNNPNATPELRTIDSIMLHCTKDKKNSNLLGVGGFGVVHSGTLNGFPVAVKEVKDVDTDVDQEYLLELKKEARILQTHQFPGVIRFFGVDCKVEPSLIVMELAVCSLHSALHDEKFKVRFDLSTQGKYRILLECCSTFAFLHSVGIVHRDIKSKNILMMADGHTKVTDFGLANAAFVQTKGLDIRGTSAHIDPDLLMSEEGPFVYDQATDMYAFAIMMNEVMTGEKQFNCTTVNLKQQMARSSKQARPPLYSDNKLGWLIDRCWNSNKSKRIKFRDLSFYLRKLIDYDYNRNMREAVMRDGIVFDVFLGSSLLSGFYTGSMRGNQRHGFGTLRCLDGYSYEGEWENDELNGFAIITKSSMQCFAGNYFNSQRHGRGKRVYTNGDVYEGDWVKDEEDGRGVYKFSDGEVYDGEFKNGVMEGRGVFRYGNGDVYDGEWKNGGREGHGTLTFNDGDSYDGEFMKGVREGSGVYRFSNGDVYDGEWKNDKREGHGTLTLSNGSSYDGNWLHDVKEGYGDYRSENGYMVVGEWKNDKKEGYGKLTLSNGNSYSGYWVNDVREGFGIYESINGFVYVGDWKNDKKQGRGTMIFDDGDCYDGDWVNGMMQGYGIFLFSSGDVYIGEWVNDLREGHGVYKYSNGGEYDGEWKKGNREGRGIMKYSNGNSYDGGFFNDAREGHGTYRLASGSMYTGEWKKNKKEGRGVQKFSSGASYYGDWMNGVKEGCGVYTYVNGDEYEGEWKKGKKIFVAR